MSGPGQVKELGSSGGAITALLSNFDVGQHFLKPEHQNWLSTKVLVKLQAGGSIWLAGLTSTTGSEGRNQTLSDNRANAVVKFLAGRLGKSFPLKVEAKYAFGEAPARLSGSRDNLEEARWRAVLVTAWDKPTPPPPPLPVPAPQQACKRTVVGDPRGVPHWAILNGGTQQGQLIRQIGLVKPSAGYRQCATPFERMKTFVAGNTGSRPVVLDYAFPDADGAVGEVVGHVFEKENRFSILADASAVKRLPKPYDTQINTLPLDAFLSGYSVDGQGDYHFFPRVPLFLSDGMRGSGYISIAYSSEDAPRYDLVTDINGEILAYFGSHPSSYPRSESMLSVGLKAGVKQLVKEIAKSVFL